MDNKTSPASRTDTVKTGDRGGAGIAIGLVIALIMVVAASQFGPLKRYLTVSPPAQRPQAAAPAVDTRQPAPPVPTAIVETPTPAAPQAAPAAVELERMPTLMLADPPPSAQAAAQPQPQPVLPTGEAGLVEAMRKGLLRPASGGDLGAWKSRWSQVNARGLPRAFDERTQTMSAYVIQRDLEIPGGLHGAHSVVFVLEKGVPYPRGDAGHSVILDQATGACIGAVCGTLLGQD